MNAENFFVAVRQLRPSHWIKNILIFAPAVIPFRLERIDLLFLGFFALNFMASFGYLVNDFINVSDDRLHPTKRFRPFAYGQIGQRDLYYLMALCFVLANSFAIFLGFQFYLLLWLYALGTLVYTFFFKKIIFLDVFWLVGLLMIRIWCGAVLTHIPITIYFFSFSFLLFLSLALHKRFSHIQRVLENDQISPHYPKQSLLYLRYLGLLTAALALLVLVTYIYSDEAHRFFPSPLKLWPIVFFIGFWIWDIYSFESSPQIIDDAVIFILTDKKSLFYVVGSFCSFFVAKFY